MAVVDPHYLWALGHAITLICSGFILLRTVLFRSIPLTLYKSAYVGTLLSYSIVVYKSLGIPQANAGWVRRAFVDENVQYAVLALYWFISKPINLTIIPFATFSLFHCLTFIRTNILPKFIPPPPPSQAGQPRPPPTALTNVSTTIQKWVKGNYDSAMRFVAYAELAILARTLLGAVTFRSSLISPLFLAHFIRLRYHASPFTRQAIEALTARLDNIANGQGGVVAQYWGVAKRAIAGWGGGRLVPEQPIPGRQGAAGAGAAAQERRAQ